MRTDFYIVQATTGTEDKCRLEGTNCVIFQTAFNGLFI